MRLFFLEFLSLLQHLNNLRQHLVRYSGSSSLSNLKGTSQTLQSLLLLGRLGILLESSKNGIDNCVKGARLARSGGGWSCPRGGGCYRSRIGCTLSRRSLFG